MCQPRKWWLGLLPLAVLWLAAAFIKLPAIESDLAERAKSGMAAIGLTDASLNVSGRDVSVAGTAVSAAAVASAQTAANVTGVRLLNSALVLAPVLKPYLFGISRDGGTITLTGAVPDPATRAALLSAAKASGAEVVDLLTIARGAPAGFPAAANALLAPFAGLSKGAAELSDSTLTFAAEATDKKAYDLVLAAKAALPNGLTIARYDVVPPPVSPYVWTADTDGSRVVLSGNVPSEAARASLLAAAKAAFPGKPIGDRMVLGRGGDPAFVDAAGAALSALARVMPGSASLNDLKLTLNGILKEGEQAETASAAISSALPKGFVLARAMLAYPLAPSFTVEALKDAQARIGLKGFAPDGAARDKAIAAAVKAGASVAGTLQLASGLPSGLDYNGLTDFALAQLGRLKTGGLLLPMAK